MVKFKVNGFFVFLFVLNMLLIFLRISIGDPAAFQGNLFSTLLFGVIFISLLITLALKKYDYFILIWISFYFACPIIKLPFTPIGSLGLLNGIFIPLMLIISFNPKNKYYLTIVTLIVISILNLADVSLRLMLSRIFEFTAPLIFFYFVFKKCKNIELIMGGIIFVSLINVPLSIYELITKASWGAFVDWRGIRIMGNLFHPNSYSMYLLPCILLLYASLRTKFNKHHFIFFITLLAMNILAFSRIGLLSLIVSLIVFEAIFKQGLKLNPKKFFLLALLILAVIAYNLIGISESHLTVGTLSERTSIWKSIAPYLKGNLVFGNGLGSYELYRSRIIYSLSPHNVYLSILFDLGIIGLIIILFFIINIMIDLFKRIRKTKEWHLTELGVALVIGLMIFSFTDGAPFSQVDSLNSWILLGCCLIYSINIKSDNKKKDVTEPLIREA